MPPAPDHVAHEGFVDDGLPRLFVREVSGSEESRPAIVVVHGGPDFSHDYLLPDMDALLAGAHRLVYYDQRGRGRSFSGVTDEDVTMATEVVDLDRVRAWFGLETVAVLGHSWGGLVAMEYAVRHPDRVSHLILMNTAPASHAGALAFREELARRRSAAQAEQMLALRSDPRFATGDIGVEAEYYRIHYGAGLRDPGQVDRVVASLRSSFTAEGVVAARAIEARLYEDTWSRPGYDLVAALEQLHVPTLLIHGDDDFVPLATVRRIAGALRGARLVVVPSCGHFAYLEQPALVRDVIAGFFADRR